MAVRAADCNEKSKEVRGKRKKWISARMLVYEFRNVTGNPYVHIFGVGMPVFMTILICRAVASEIRDPEVLSATVTTVFLGIGAMIPMASVLMGYGISHAQELEKGIPQRMELFGIPAVTFLSNRVVAEMVFMALAYVIYFAVGYGIVGVEAPKITGAVWYGICILILSVILFCLAHGVSSLLKKFGLTYCVTMLIYFALMMLGGMMGVSYDQMPGAMQQIAKLLPVTYINRDFYTVWKGESYNFVPMLQSFLFMGAVSGIILFVSVKRGERGK